MSASIHSHRMRSWDWIFDPEMPVSITAENESIIKTDSGYLICNCIWGENSLPHVDRWQIHETGNRTHILPHDLQPHQASTEMLHWQHPKVLRKRRQKENQTGCSSGCHRVCWEADDWVLAAEMVVLFCFTTVEVKEEVVETFVLFELEEYKLNQVHEREHWQTGTSYKVFQISNFINFGRFESKQKSV